jgi:hypothetical protein
MQLYTFYFNCKLLYMFRVDFPPINKSINNSREKVVSIAKIVQFARLGVRLTARKRFFSKPKRTDRPQDPPSTPFNGQQISFLPKKTVRFEVDPSPPPTAEVKNRRNYCFTFRLCLHGLDREMHNFLNNVLPFVSRNSILVNKELDTQFFFMYVYFYSLHVSDSHVSIIRRISCISTKSGMCQSV